MMKGCHPPPKNKITKTIKTIKNKKQEKKKQENCHFFIDLNKK